MIGYVYNEAKNTKLKYSRWTYGNRLGMWYPIGSDDRDWDIALSNDFLNSHTEAESIKIVMGVNLIKSIC